MKLGYIIPIASISIDNLQGWVGVPLKELHDEALKLRLALKKAAAYTWDNSHFIVMHYSKHNPVMEFLPSETLLSFWDARTGTTLYNFEKPLTKNQFLMLRVAANNIEEGLVYCQSCDTWVKEFKRYDFAGAVCNQCYDPQRHLSPDTRGD